RRSAAGQAVRAFVRPPCERTAPWTTRAVARCPYELVALPTMPAIARFPYERRALPAMPAVAGPSCDRAAPAKTLTDGCRTPRGGGERGTVGAGHRTLSA